MSFEMNLIHIYSVILGFLGKPMRFIVPPHQNFYERYTAEHHNNNANKSIKIYEKSMKLDIYIKIDLSTAYKIVVTLGALSYRSYSSPYT